VLAAWRLGIERMALILGEGFTGARHGFVRVMWAGSTKPCDARGLAIFANTRFGLHVANSLLHKRFHFVRRAGISS
jgi:hypothetical protein